MIMKKIIFLISFICISLSIVQGQTVTKDSIIAGVFEAYNLMSKTYLVQSHNLLNQLEKDALKLNDTIALAYLYNVKGVFYNATGNYELSNKLYNKSRQFYDSQIKTDDDEPTKRSLMVLGNIAINYKKKKEYAKSDSLLLYCIKRLNKLHYNRVFFSYRALAETYLERGYYNETIDLCDEAYAEFQTYDFANESEIVKKRIPNRILKRIMLLKAFALFELNKDLNEANRILDEYSFGDLELSVWDDYFVQAKINNYKFQYFDITKRNNDSLEHYRKLVFKNTNTTISIIDSIKVELRKYNWKYFVKEQEIQKEQLLQQNKINELKNTKIIITLISFLVGLLILLIFFIIKSFRKQKDLNKVLVQKNGVLKNIDEQRLRFFSVMSHELRTPIHGIYSAANLLEKEENEKEISNYLNIISYSSTHLKTLINNMLQYSRFELEKIQLKSEETNLKALIQSVVNSFSNNAKNENCKIHLSFDSNIPEVNTDQSILSQILINLIGNAIKYTTNGNIWVIASLEDKTETAAKVTLKVKDDGIGIQKEDQEFIFNAFKGVNNNFGDSTGLGLYIVKNLLSLFDSKIYLQSAKNEGATFFFTVELPRSRGLLENQEERPVIKNKKVLVVDDNRINVIVTKKTLEKEGCICDSAMSGEAAIELVKQNEYDIVLMDINMDVMNGYEASVIITSLQPSLPIIALTALDFNEVQVKAKISNISSILTKPFKKEDLITQIHYLTMAV